MSTAATDRTGEHGLSNLETPAPIPTPSPNPAPAPTGRGNSGGQLYRFSVEQYQHIGKAGILTPDDRVELIEGFVVEKMTKYERHIATTKMMYRSIDRNLPAGWHVGKEDPVLLNHSEPEPDVSILRGEIEDYLRRKPTGADIALVVEVADTSYAFDRRKGAIYAEAGIPIYWIANLNADRIEVYSDPTGPDPTPEYRSRADYARGAEIPLVIEGNELARLAVDSLLAPTQPK